jgi:hypothetical protein
MIRLRQNLSDLEDMFAEMKALNESLVAGRHDSDRQFHLLLIDG